MRHVLPILLSVAAMSAAAESPVPPLPDETARTIRARRPTSGLPRFGSSRWRRSRSTIS